MNFILFYFKIRATKSGTKLFLMDLYGYGTFCPPLFIFLNIKIIIVIISSFFFLILKVVVK